MKKDIFQILGAFLIFAVIAIMGASSVANMSVVAQSSTALDKTQTSLSLKPYGLQWTPDGHISYITLPKGERRYFLGANQRSYVIVTKSNMTLENAIKTKPTIKQVFGPDVNVSYRNNYSTIAQVLQLDSSDPYHVWGLTQNEQQATKSDGSFDTGNFTARIGLLESFDGGMTWKDYGPVIRGDDYIDPGTKLTGAGEPSAIVNNGYVYIYYTDWSAQTVAFHPDEIFLARSKILDKGSMGAMEFFTANGFVTQEANLQAVIYPSQDEGYVSLPSVSFNKYLNSFLAIYEVDKGFKSATSVDGINWTNSKMVLTFSKPLSQRAINDTWYSYPSFLSDNQEQSDQLTDKTGNLYFSEGVWPNTAHQPAVKKIEVL